MQANHLIKTLFLVVAVTAILGGCSNNQRSDQQQSDRKDPQLALARGAVDREDYAQAAVHYLLLAEKSDATARGRYQLLAAENQFRTNDYAGCEGTLSSINPDTLTETERFRFGLLNAQLELQDGQYLSALVFLEAAPPENSRRNLLLRLYQNRALAYRLVGDKLNEIKALRLLDVLLSDPQQQLDNQLEILRGVMLAGPLLDPDLETQGWNSLTDIAARAGDAFYPEYLNWRVRYPDHPAQSGLLRYFFEEKTRLQVQTERIAIFLPTAGRYANVAKAIRDGIIANWSQAEPDQRSILKFYDSTDTSQIWPIYQQAIDDGAQVVVGPLQKSAVIQLARAGELPIPVLALNQVDIDSVSPQNLYQYALAPEDEAAQVAQYSMATGNSNALVLYPENEWGRRIATAFTESLRAIGGHVAISQAYDAVGHDFSGTIKSALLLEESRIRQAEMQRILGKKLQFTPRRRADIDYIFLIAKPRQARQIRPQLQFFYAADLPVRSTSQAWTGNLTRQQALDVVGIQLPDIPWLLVNDPQDPLAHERFTTLFPNSRSSLGRLYAMGMDAYTLLPDLRRLQNSELESLDGRTGNLYMDRSRHIHRLLVWVELGEDIKVLGYSTRPVEPVPVAPVTAPTVIH